MKKILKSGKRGLRKRKRINMDFFEVIKKRHSARTFKNKKVEEEKLEKILKTVNLAPSAGNLQAYEIVIVKEKVKKEKLAEAALMQEFIAAAPVVLIFLANYERSMSKYGERGKFYAILDATIAAAYAQLAATALGLATCWVGAFDDDTVLKILNAGKNYRAVAIMPLGYAKEKPFITERRDLAELVHEEKL